MIQCVVPISGGKDSQVCLELALEHFDKSEVRGLFCDTKFEHPLTYGHVARMADLYGVQIDRVCGGSVLEKVLKYERFPGGGARHCTDELKIRETKIYCRELAERQGKGFEVWYGMRSGESSDRARRYASKVSNQLYAPHEVMPRKYPKYLAKMGVMFRLPILDWSEDEVFERLGGMGHPHYSQGFGRVGCYPCLAAGDAAKEKAFQHDDFGRQQLAKAQAVADQIGKSIWTSKGGKARNEVAGCAVCAI